MSLEIDPYHHLKKVDICDLRYASSPYCIGCSQYLTGSSTIRKHTIFQGRRFVEYFNMCYICSELAISIEDIGNKKDVIYQGYNGYQ